MNGHADFEPAVVVHVGVEKGEGFTDIFKGGVSGFVELNPVVGLWSVRQVLGDGGGEIADGSHAELIGFFEGVAGEAAQVFVGDDLGFDGFVVVIQVVDSFVVQPGFFAVGALVVGVQAVAGA